MCPGASSIVSRLDHVAQAGDEPVATRVEDATGGRVGGTWDFAAERDSGPHLTVDARHRRQQGLGVRMVGSVEDLLGRTELHDAAEVHDRDPVAEVTHHAEVVGDEQVTGAVAGLEVGEHVEDRRLDRDVERARRLVAHDDARVTGEGAGDGDALLEAAGELARLEVEVAL